MLEVNLAGRCSRGFFCDLNHTIGVIQNTDWGLTAALNSSGINGYGCWRMLHGISRGDRVCLVAQSAFGTYKSILAFSIYRGFQKQEVHPLELPVDEKIELVPYHSQAPAANIHKLYAANNYPQADRAEPRLRKIKTGQKFIKGLSWLPLKGVPSMPAAHDAYIKAVYPPFYKKAWPKPPEVPPELRDIYGPAIYGDRKSVV